MKTYHSVKELLRWQKKTIALPVLLHAGWSRKKAEKTLMKYGKR